MIKEFRDTRTSSALRKLAKDIDDGIQEDFVFITFTDSGDIQHSYKATDRPYTVIGIMQSLMIDIKDGEIE